MEKENSKICDNNINSPTCTNGKIVPDVELKNEKEFKEKKAPFIKLRNKRCIIIISISLLILIITFLIILFKVILKKKNKKFELQNENNNNNNNNIENIEDKIENVVELSFKINHVKIYQEIQTTNTTIIFEENEYDENNIRRLSKKDIEKETITTKYLINIYEKNDLNDNLNTSIFSAYALVLSSMKKKKIQIFIMVGIIFIMRMKIKI